MFPAGVGVTGLGHKTTRQAPKVAISAAPADKTRLERALSVGEITPVISGHASLFG